MAVGPTPSPPPLSPSTSATHSRTTDTFATDIAPAQTIDSRAEASDLDPAAFLKSVRELSEKREREDAERVRKLEEEIEKGRRERARRRQERARSISPEKTDAPPLRPLSLRRDSKSTERSASEAGEPPSSAAMDEGTSEAVPEFKGFGSIKSNSSASSAHTSEHSQPTQSASSLARSGTLSWQRRPASRGANSRPQSVALGEGRGKEPATSSQDEPEKSRDQIAASLGSRDPTWFKQTADRGMGRAAFRRSKDETGADSPGSSRRGLPGMSRETSAEPSRGGSPAPSESVRSDNTSRPSSVRDSTFSAGAFSATRTSTSSKPDLKSLIAADESQEKASPMSDRTSSAADGEQSSLGRTPTMSSSQTRLANAQDRPASPTKGMGGFVSSAMMKRADSQTKRWSAQPGGSLSRQNSLASARSGFGGLQGSHSMPKLEPTSDSREASNEPASRPTSSSSNLTDLAAAQGKEGKDVFVKPSLPGHSRTKSVASNYSTTAEEGHTSPPASPSKRWSPTKSSWLESSITKPESPKPVSARNSQPDWMANIAKAKAQRASAETAPKAVEEPSSRSSSPTKAMFGQGMLKRSESRDLGTPRSLTPKPAGPETPRSASPVKSAFGGQSSLQRSESRDFNEELGRSTPVLKEKSPEVAQKPILDAPSTSPEKVVDDADKKPPVPAKPELPSTEAQEIPTAAVKSPSPQTTKPKPEPASKPQTDFRSTLRSRPPPEAKQAEQPEFLAKFGHLKKAETKNYVAPDVLKDNILRGKGDLTKTGGPVKTVRRDELKESLLAKKEQWKKEKDEGIVHERKTSNPPATPQKPEALAKRELMGRSGSVKQAEGTEKPNTSTPEALARHKSLRDKPQLTETMPPITKQTSEPSAKKSETDKDSPRKQSSTPNPATSPPPKQVPETSKLASRFNPGLASMLARGPPASSNDSQAPSRSQSPSVPQRAETPAEPPADGAALQDMRKGRAKGPKKRKAGTGHAREAPAETTSTPPPAAASAPVEPVDSPKPLSPAPGPAAEEMAVPKSKPRAPPGSAASIMMASLQKSPPAESEKPATPLKGQSAISPEPSKPATPAKSPSLSSKPSVEPKPEPAKPSAATPKPTLFGARPMQSRPGTPAKSSVPAEEKPAASSRNEVPEFAGFGSVKRSESARPNSAVRLVDENKENIAEGSPSVKSAASMWGKQDTPKRADAPGQIQLPSKKDEEAAMRSAGLLASSPSRPGSRDGLGIALEQARSPAAQTPPPSAGAPPKPAKSSRSVSGQMAASSPNQGVSGSLEQPQNAVEEQIHNALGCVPNSSDRLSIDTASVIASQPHPERIFKTIRKTVQLVSPEGVLRQLPAHQEYTFFDECVYVFTHAYTIANGPKKAEVFVWVGSSASQAAADQAQSAAKKLAKTEGNAYIATVRHGFEPPGFLQALGGILITRSGAQEGSSKQYMLCGRQHMGQIAFDEVFFSISTLCSGFAYLISFPVTLQETRLYLWKGAAASPEEVSAARLAAMDLSETGEIIEVDDRAEFASFLKIFGPGTTKSSITPPSDLWQAKAEAPSRFATRLFRIQKAEQKTGGGGMFGSFFARRPSWNSAGAASSPGVEGGIKAEAKEISPFTQSDLEAEGIYLLDAWATLYVLVGPVFGAQPEGLRGSLLAQTLLFAAEYGVLAASTEERPAVPRAEVVLAGVPGDVPRLFRFWDEGLGLWGTGGLMAGSAVERRASVLVLGIEDARKVVCGG